MLKSRRGLLAAGLAVAVVGSLGVASTISAGADEITAPPAAEASADISTESPDAGSDPAEGPVENVDTTGEVTAAEAAAPVPVNTRATPPALLPWGEKPRKAKRGKAGMSSKALRATGAVVAPDDTSGRIAPTGALGPKGRTSSETFLRSEVTEEQPPAPAPAPNSTTAPPPVGDDGTTKVFYNYNLGRQEAVAEGAYATLSINKPTLSRYDYHSLAEVAVQSADGRQIVEIGWHVNRLVNGDDDPRLFVYHWVDRKPSCYNGCGFVQHSPNLKPGDRLPFDKDKPPVSAKFGILYTGDAWWVSYDLEYIGYFPEKLWNDQGVKFDKSGLVQVFGEVAATEETPCSGMGSGVNPYKAEKEAAFVYNFGYTNGPPIALEVRSTNEEFYNLKPGNNADKNGNRSFRYGGQGATC